jgi:ATP-dependent Lhr-like helicase
VTDDGFVVRFPETDEPPDPKLMILVGRGRGAALRQLGGTAMAGRSSAKRYGPRVLLPKRRPGGRSPAAAQRAADLLAVAAQFGSFPMLLEAYRECLRDVFDMPALVDTLRRIERRETRGDGRFDNGIAVRLGAALWPRRQLHQR